MRLMTVAIALALLTSSAAQAQTQATSTASITDGVIYACYVPKTGTVYRINVSGSPTKCAANHVSFSWNITGPEGPEGPAAPAGVVGHRIIKDSKSVIAQTSGNITLLCAADEVILGGGYAAFDNVAGTAFKNFTVQTNAPIEKYPEFPGGGWAALVFNTDPSTSFELSVYAICAKVAN